MNIHPGIIASAEPTYSSEVQQFFDRLISLPTLERQTLYANLIDSLVTDGTWSAIDALYVFAASDSGTSLINLKQDSFVAQRWTASGSPTFTANQGWLTAGINSNIHSNFNPSTAGGHFSLNSACIGTWSLTTTQSNSLAITSRTQSSLVELWPKYNNGNSYWSVNGAEQTTTGVADSSGWFFLNRTGASAQSLYRNNTLVDSKTNSATSLVNEILHFQGQYKHAAAVIGAGLTNSQKTTLYTGLQTYLTAVGAI